MTKRSRDYTAWTNEEIAEDPEGYIAAQAAYREDQAAEEDRKREQRDFEQWRRSFVEEGGQPAEARAAWVEQRAREAAEAVVADEEASRRRAVSTTRRAL